ncbi:MFS transporter [Chitinilyticum litopenaei]|uniref:MFS transporter n=1 Tax=Chitinilyticum litopenaei TaxID=1121276 RepID=UPI00041B60FC|nr:MFS transporter [Chitinilyticum litopenaei]
MTDRREMLLLLALMLVMFTTIVDFMIMMPLASYLIADLRISTGQFGLLVSSYSLAAGVSALLASSQADRFDRRHALLFCYAGLTVGTLLCALAGSFASLLAARIVAGVFGGVLGSITLAIVGDVIPLERRGRAMSWVMLGFSLSAVAGVPLGLWLAAHQGWRMPFYVLAGVCALLWLLMTRAVPPVRDHLARTPGGWLANYRELLSDRNHWWAVGLTALLMVSGFSVIPFIAPTMVANVGLAPEQLMYIYLAGGAATIFTRPVIGRLTDRYTPRRVVGWLIVLSFLPIVLVTQTLAVGLSGQLAIAVLFFVFVSGRFIPATTQVTAATRPELRGRLMAFNSAVQNFASGIASLAAGMVLTQDSHGVWHRYGWVGLASCAAGVLAIWVAGKIRTVS